MTSHYLILCWHKSTTLSGVTKPHWVRCNIDSHFILYSYIRVTVLSGMYPEVIIWELQWVEQCHVEIYVTLNIVLSVSFHIFTENVFQMLKINGVMALICIFIHSAFQRCFTWISSSINIYLFYNHGRWWHDYWLLSKKAHAINAIIFCQYHFSWVTCACQGVTWRYATYHIILHMSCATRKGTT